MYTGQMDTFVLNSLCSTEGVCYLDSINLCDHAFSYSNFIVTLTLCALSVCHVIKFSENECTVNKLSSSV